MKPKHLAFTTVGLKDNPGPGFQLIHRLIDEQVSQKIPVFTFYIAHKNPHPDVMAAFTYFLESEALKKQLNQNRIKITALGKWYDLPQHTVNAVKKILDETKDYDTHFLNFCINYDGQEEIVDACKLIVRQILAGKLSESAITEETIKESLYTSYFIPPDVIIKSGPDQKQSSFLLWDSVGAKLYFTGKSFTEFTVEELNKLIQQPL